MLELKHNFLVNISVLLTGHRLRSTNLKCLAIKCQLYFCENIIVTSWRCKALPAGQNLGPLFALFAEPIPGTPGSGEAIAVFYVFNLPGFARGLKGAVRAVCMAYQISCGANRVVSARA